MVTPLGITIIEMGILLMGIAIISLYDGYIIKASGVLIILLSQLYVYLALVEVMQ